MQQIPEQSDDEIEQESWASLVEEARCEMAND
jgi:hypothetical protein